MRIQRIASLFVTSTTLSGLGGLDAQTPRTPEAALEDLATDGRVSNEELFMFQGCPQADAVGRTIFDAVQTVQLDGWGLQSLAHALSWKVYATCGYGPLDAWMTRTFELMRSRGDLSPASAFIRGLGPIINEDLQRAILDAAVDQSFGDSRTREEFVRVALTARPRERMIEEAIGAFRLPIPRQAKASTTYRLSREFGSAFFEAVTRAAPSLTDDDLFTIARAIGSEIQNGRLEPNARGLDQLRSLVQARPGRMPSDEIPTARRPPVRGP